jgi:hypothetical protein
MTSKPTTVWLDDDDRKLVERRKRENGKLSFSALVRMWLRVPPRKR